VPHGYSNPERWIQQAEAARLPGALEARQIPASEGRLVGEATGEIEVEDGVLR
jgi:hypothetical protein